MSRARRTIENTFGILASKWRILERPIIAKVETIEKIVQALVCLHNLLKKRDANKGDNGRYCPNNYVDREDENGCVIPGEWRNERVELSGVRRMGGNAYAHSAVEIRNGFMEYFMQISPIDYQWSK